MIDTSQNGETTIVRRYFKDHIGWYLSIGENDGKTLSNVYGLYTEGWLGINMEPCKEAFDRMVINQPNCVNINAAIGLSIGRGTIYQSGEHLGQGDVSLVSTFKKEEMKRWSKETFTPVEVEILPITVVVPPHPCDLLSLDIEGMELEVLPSIMAHIQPTMAIIEYNGKNRQAFDKIMAGYTVIHSNGENLIYTRNNVDNINNKG
jgi:FkbM family methyltransferase